MVGGAPRARLMSGGAALTRSANGAIPLRYDEAAALPVWKGTSGNMVSAARM